MGIRIEKLPNTERLIEEIRQHDGRCPLYKDRKCLCKEFWEQKEGLCPCGVYKKTKVEDYK